jgi:hypothetical protein
MSELQDVIATSTIKAFNHGVQFERDRIIRMLEAESTKGTEPLAYSDLIRGIKVTVKND